MHYLGIDVGKRTHVASMIDDSGKNMFKAFSFTNTTEGADSLTKRLDEFKLSSDDITIGMEATGHYWLSLYSYLTDKGYVIHVINPIQTDGWRKGIEIRKRKTDIIDSVLIADLIRYGNFLETSLMDENTMTLRNLARFRNYQVESISDLKRKVICVLDQIFPEYDTVFSNIFGKTSTEILLNFSSPADFEDITSNQLEEFLNTISLKDFARKKIDTLSKLAKGSFGVTFGKSGLFCSFDSF